MNMRAVFWIFSVPSPHPPVAEGLKRTLRVSVGTCVSSAAKDGSMSDLIRPLASCLHLKNGDGPFCRKLLLSTTLFTLPVGPRRSLLESVLNKGVVSLVISSGAVPDKPPDDCSFFRFPGASNPWSICFGGVCVHP